jgi:outer membrane biosynthesis protein TonB
MTDRSDTGRSDRGFIVALMALLVASLLGNVFLFEKWNQSELTVARLSIHLERVAKDLTKETTDVEATLNECNAALASVQAKPIAAPVVCPTLPPTLICPPAPAPIIAQEPQACPPMPACPTPEPIPAPNPGTPVAPEPARVVQHYYFHPHVHRRHHPATTPCCKCEWKWEN